MSQRAMHSSVLPLGARPSSYFENERKDMVGKLPRPLGRVLDVGCGSGSVGRTLRRAGASHLTGIELNERAAALSAEVFDVVVQGDIEKLVHTLDGPFDTICCYDVLEHLYDPATVLDRLRTAAAPGGHLHISIPNARHFSLLRDLIFRGTFGYEPLGHRDVTHLRWFTRRDVERLVDDCGWKLVDTTTHSMRPGRAALAALTRGSSNELFAVQWHVLCRAA